MSKYYIATQEEVTKDREDWFNEHPGDAGQVGHPPELDDNRLVRRWRHLLETQNGEDFDDYSVDPGKYEQIVAPWVEKGASVLGIGVGTGREVASARSLGYDCVGTTLGKKNPSFAEWKLGLTQEDIFFGDNCTLPWSSNQFDAVVGFQIFEHCHAPYMFLFECARVLKPGGQLILEWPPYIRTGNGTLVPDEKSGNMMSDYNEDNMHHACCWTPAQGNIMVRRSGFEDLEVYLSNYKSQDKPIASDGPVPANHFRIDETDPAWYSNVAPMDIVLRARRRPDHKMPYYGHKLINITE